MRVSAAVRSQPQRKRLGAAGGQPAEVYLTGFSLSKQAEGISANTIADYRSTFGYLSRWPDLAGRDLLSLQSQDLKGFLVWLSQQTSRTGRVLARKTIYNAWVGLRSFYG